MLTRKINRGTLVTCCYPSTFEQVNAFLAGRSPLTLAMRLGSHMMFVQLQLSTTPPGTSKHHPPSAKSPRHRCATTRGMASVPSASPQAPASTPNTHRQSCIPKPTPILAPLSLTPETLTRNPQDSVTRKLNVPSQLSNIDSKSVPHSPHLGMTAPSMASGNPFPSSPLPGQPAPGFPHPEGAQEGASGQDRPRTSCGHMPVGAQCPASPSTPGPVSPTLPFLDSSSFAEAKRSLSLRLKEFSQNATSHIQEVITRSMSQTRPNACLLNETLQSTLCTL